MVVPWGDAGKAPMVQMVPGQEGRPVHITTATAPRSHRNHLKYLLVRLPVLQVPPVVRFLRVRFPDRLGPGNGRGSPGVDRRGLQGTVAW